MENFQNDLHRNHFEKCTLYCSAKINLAFEKDCYLIISMTARLYTCIRNNYNLIQPLKWVTRIFYQLCFQSRLTTTQEVHYGKDIDRISPTADPVDFCQ